MDYELDLTPAQKAELIARKKIQTRDEEALVNIMSTKPGRWFIMRLLERTHILDVTLPEADHATRMLIAEGERRIGMGLVNNLQASRDLFDLKQEAEKEYFLFMDGLKNTVRAAEIEDKH